MAVKLRRDRVLPLSEFPAEHRERIQAQVAAPKPPARYLSVGFACDPRPLARMESRAWWEWHWQRGIYPETQRRSLDPVLRASVIRRDGLVCGLCGGGVEPDDVHIDHKKPVSRGGTNHPDNLQVTHSKCNLRKGART